MNDHIEQRLIDSYISHVDEIGVNLPMWFNAARREYVENFNLCMLPDKHDERYRLSDIKELFDRGWGQIFSRKQAENEVAGVMLNCNTQKLPLTGHQIDIRNGFVTGAALEVLENGVIFGSLATAAVDFEQIVKRYYNSIAENKTDAVTALASTFTQDGAFIYVPENVSVELPFILNYYYGTDVDPIFCCARTMVVLERGASAEIVVSQHGCGSVATLIDYVREVSLGKSANLKLSEYCTIGDNHSMVLSSYVNQSEDSCMQTTLVSLGGAFSRINYAIDLMGERADAKMYGLYLISDEQKSDINIDVNHLVPDCTSYEMVKGVAASHAFGAFTGRVYVAPNAQRTQAFQQSRNLLLSDTARIYTKPQLEIYADDVKCSHGATVGQLDAEAIYYMRQRGISELDARKLQMSGFVNDIIAHAPTERLAAHVYNLVATKIDSL